MTILYKYFDVVLGGITLDPRESESESESSQTWLHMGWAKLSSFHYQEFQLQEKVHNKGYQNIYIISIQLMIKGALYFDYIITYFVIRKYQTCTILCII